MTDEIIAAAERQRLEERRTDRAVARELLEPDERRDLYEKIRYWQAQYAIVVEILAAQCDDPALAWIDEVVRVRSIPAIPSPRGDSLSR